MRRTFISFVTLCILLNLAGCTRVANRIYTVCKVDGDTSYVYNSDGEFFTLKNDVYLKHSGVGLECKPALKLVTTDKQDYAFTKTLPGLYVGTLENVSSYVNTLKSNDYSVDVRRADCKDIEVFCTSTDGSVRILFNISGTVRLYAIDASGTSIEPPFIVDE